MPLGYTRISVHGWLLPQEQENAQSDIICGPHAVTGRHLDYYLDEYTFRFNRRTSRSRGLLFYRLMQQAVVMPPVSYRQIINSADHNI